MKLRRFLGMSLAIVGLVTFTQANVQALGWGWGCGCGGYGIGSGLGYGYRYNFGGPGWYSGYRGACPVGYGYGLGGYGGYGGYGYGGYGGYGYGGYGYGGYGSGGYGYGCGRCGFAVKSGSGSAATYASSWRGYPPELYVMSCCTGGCASGSSSQSIDSRPEIANSATANIETASLTQPSR